MLEPGQRLLYLDELKPPLGYRLDQAIATTYSADLLTLLTVPLSFVVFDSDDPEKQLREPVAILEALRRTRDRFTLFCQQGRIAVPRADSQLYSYLEPVVTEVRASNPDGAFHPKCWVIRYVGKEPDSEPSDPESVRYRFLCLSRNLTFDRSWDVALCLDGILDQSRLKGFSNLRPLGDFIAALPGLAVEAMSAEARKRVETIADEVRRVQFERPDDCDEFTILPGGIEGYRGIKPISDLDKARRLIVVSPFLSERTVTELLESGPFETSDPDEQNYLISRVDSLDELSPKTLERLFVNTALFSLNPSAEHPEPDGDESPPSGESSAGLHAKLYLADLGWDSELTLGSANATRAGLGGQNVELAVRLTGKKSRLGIDQFLASGEQQDSFRMMLQPYQRVEERAARARALKACEDQLEAFSDALVAANLRVVITTDTSGHRFAITPRKALPIPEGVTASCHPVSLPAAQARQVAPFAEGAPVIFPALALESLTRFVAFRLTTQFEDQTLTHSFALNLPVEGMPEGRDTAILHHIISSPDRFVRYLLFLMSDPDDPYQAGNGVGLGGAAGGNGDRSGVAGIPLLETLVRICSRHPERLKPIDKLVNEFLARPDRQQVLPPGFEALWSVIRAGNQGAIDG